MKVKTPFWMSPFRTRHRAVPVIDDQGLPTGETVKASFFVADVAPSRKQRHQSVEVEFACEDTRYLKPDEKKLLVRDAVARALHAFGITLELAEPATPA